MSEPYLVEMLLRGLEERPNTDLTRAKVYGVPANFLTAMRYPCHDEDLIRSLPAQSHEETFRTLNRTRSGVDTPGTPE